MAESDGATAGKGFFSRVWAFIKRPSSMSWSVLVAVGVVAGIVLWGLQLGNGTSEHRGVLCLMPRDA
jgi:hypothetical protein